MAAQIKIYVSTYCAYCRMAERYFDKEGWTWEAVDVTNDPKTRAWLVGETKQRTVPQIFIGDQSICGYTDMVAMDRRGELRPLLGVS